MINEIKKYAINCHRNANHLYDNYLPYEYHLNMVAGNAYKYRLLIDNIRGYGQHNEYTLIMGSCYLHDTIEDTRTTYSDIRGFILNGIYAEPSFISSLLTKDFEAFSSNVADIVYAVTNEKGRNRAERENDKYFEGIRNTPYATFVKLCDRIANVEYSRLTE